MLWIWNFDQCGPFTNEDHCMTSIFNFLDQWNIIFGLWNPQKWRDIATDVVNCHRLSRCTSGEKFELLTWKVSVFGIFLVSIFLHLSEYLDLQSKSPYSVWMRENMNKKNSEYGHFYTVLSICRYWDLTVMKGVTQLLFYINHKELRGRFFKTYLFF